MKHCSSQTPRHGARFISLAVFLITTFSAFLASGQSTETIYDAMREGKVTATFTATGGSSGDSIYLNISKTPAAGYGTLTITVPPGLRLQNQNGAWQSMVVSGVRGLWQGGNQYVPQSLIVLNDAAPSATYLLSAYCAEFHKDNPSPASQFVVSPPDSATACILSNASAQGLSVAATQAAEWINTDHVTFSDLQSKFPVSFPDWNAAGEVASQCYSALAQVQPQPVQTQQAAQMTQYSAPAVNLDPGIQPVSFQLKHSHVSVLVFYQAGTLSISPDRISWEENGPKAQPSHNFQASCSALDSAGLHGNHRMLYIRLRNGKYTFETASENESIDVLRAISRVCPQIPSPGK